MSGAPQNAPPNRYRTSRTTLILDQAMTWFIKGGGLAVIVAVFGIFVFILWQVLPLFRSATVTPSVHQQLPAPINTEDVLGLLSDEYGELPLIVQRDGTAHFLPLQSRHGPEEQATPLSEGELQPANLALGDTAEISAFSADHRHSRVIIGTTDGRLAIS